MAQPAPHTRFLTVPLPPGQEPNATKTPVSLGHLLMNLQQRNEADQGLNQSLGLGFAAFAQPRVRQMVSHIFNVDQPDPTRLGETLMNLNTQQGGVDRTNALGQLIASPRGAQLAQQLNISQEELKARYLADPTGVGAMIANFAAPTEATKNYNQARGLMKAQGMTDEQINAVMPPEMLALGGVSTPDYREFVLARTRAIQSGQPLPPELQDYPTYQASRAAKARLMGDQANDLAESQAKFGDQVAKMNEVERITSSVQNATEADGATPVMKAILESPTKKAAAASLLQSGEPGAVQSLVQQGMQFVAQLTPEEKTAIANLKQLTSSTYATAFTSTGSRRTQQEVANIASSLSQLGNFNQPYQSYDNSLNNLHRLNQIGAANAYGAAGRLDDVPDNLKPLVNPIYLPEQRDEKGNVVRARGPLYTGAGGDWATKATAPTISISAPSATIAPTPAPSSGDGSGAVNTSVRTPADVARLPKGTRFLVPDGSDRIGVAPGPGG